MLKYFVLGTGGAGVVLFVLFFGVLISALIGAFAGWVLGFVFPATMALASTMLGIDADPWQLGVIFGFIGGFFRSHNNKG